MDTSLKSDEQFRWTPTPIESAHLPFSISVLSSLTARPVRARRQYPSATLPLPSLANSPHPPPADRATPPPSPTLQFPPRSVPKSLPRPSSAPIESPNSPTA